MGTQPVSKGQAGTTDGSPRGQVEARGESHRMWAESGSGENTLSTVRTWREGESYKPTGCKMENGQRDPGPRVRPGQVSRAEGILALLLLVVWSPGSLLGR